MFAAREPRFGRAAMYGTVAGVDHGNARRWGGQKTCVGRPASSYH